MPLQTLNILDWYELRGVTLVIQPWRLAGETLTQAALRVWHQAQKDGYEITEILPFIKKMEKQYGTVMHADTRPEIINITIINKGRGNGWVRGYDVGWFNRFGRWCSMHTFTLRADAEAYLGQQMEKYYATQHQDA
jgi:hypothetical protein